MGQKKFRVPAVLPLEIPCPNAQCPRIFFFKLEALIMRYHWALGQGISRGKIAGTQNLSLLERNGYFWTILSNLETLRPNPPQMYEVDLEKIPYLDTPLLSHCVLTNQSLFNWCHFLPGRGGSITNFIILRSEMTTDIVTDKMSHHQFKAP